MSDSFFQIYPGTHLVIEQYGQRNIAPRIWKISEQYWIDAFELVDAIINKGSSYYGDIWRKPFEWGLKTVIHEVIEQATVIIDDENKKIAVVYDE